jgi:hypothetical protein
MANSEHLQILMQSIEAWNAWRDQHRGTVEVDATLSSATLSGADLLEATLTGYVRDRCLCP